MGRLLDRLVQRCENCGSEGYPRRISGRYHDATRERIFLWECRDCEFIWKEEMVNPSAAQVETHSFFSPDSEGA